MGDVRIVPMTCLLGQGALCFLGTARYPGHRHCLQVCLPILALVWYGQWNSISSWGLLLHLSCSL